jgi:hypothetical protein
VIEALPMLRLLATLLLFVVPCVAQAQDKAKLDSVSVHLFLTKSGTLSPDVTVIPNFFARNFEPNGEGFAEGERFEAILIKVRLTAPRETFAKGPQAELVISDSKTKKVIRRERIADVYIGSHGWTFVPVFMAKAACTPLEVVATGGGQRIAKSLGFSCGE